MAASSPCASSNSMKKLLFAFLVVVALVLSRPATACSGHPCPKPDGKCPVNAVKLGMCADVLDGLIHVVVGKPPSKEPCCLLISGLADLEAAVCCLAINANVLGVNLDVAADLSLLVNYCGRTVPAGFQCA